MPTIAELIRGLALAAFVLVALAASIVVTALLTVRLNRRPRRRR